MVPVPVPVEAENVSFGEIIRGKLRTPILEAVDVDSAWFERRRLTLGRFSVPVPAKLVVGTVGMTIKPLPQHRVDLWDELARRLATRWDFPLHAVVDQDQTRFRVNFTSRALSSYAPFDPDEWRAAMEAVPRSIPFGPTGHVGEDPFIRWHLDKAPHGITSGATNGGKSTPIRLAIAGQLDQGARVIVANGRRRRSSMGEDLGRGVGRGHSSGVVGCGLLLLGGVRSPATGPP